MSISHCFGVPGRFTTTVRLDTCWREMTQNSQSSHFMAVFMSSCPLFYGSKAIYIILKTRYMFESYDQKLVVFVFYGRFHELCPQFYGSRAIYINLKT